MDKLTWYDNDGRIMRAAADMRLRWSRLAFYEATGLDTGAGGESQNYYRIRCAMMTSKSRANQKANGG